MIFLLPVNGVNCMDTLKIFRQSLHSQNKFHLITMQYPFLYLSRFDNIQCNILFWIPASVFMREYWFVILLSCNIIAMFCIGFVLASVNKLGCRLSFSWKSVCKVGFLSYLEELSREAIWAQSFKKGFVTELLSLTYSTFFLTSIFVFVFFKEFVYFLLSYQIC